jgi:regulator of nonsense transcripts 2
MNFEVPELASEKTLRYENQKKAETRLEKINKYDPFSDEKEYKFYTINISTKLYEVYYTKPDDDKIPKKLDSLIEETLKCDTKETIDSISNSFLCNGKIITQKSKRLYLFEKILKDDRCNLENIKYFARLFKNISPIIKDLSDELVQFLIDSFHEYKPKQIYESNNNTNVNTGVLFSLCLKDIRFISEMVKFGAFPIKDVFDIIRDLLDDFKFKSIECLCQLLDNCGRYIYLNKASQERFGQLLDNIKKMAHNNLTHDDRAFKIITYSISICKPQEKSLIKKVKKRSIEEEYLRFLMNNCLNGEENSIKKVACLIRRFDWNKDENIIFKVILKYLLSSNEDKISNCCRMLYLLKNNHQKFFFNLINVILEEVRIGLERNDFNDNQHKLILSIIIGNFYLNKIINADLIFYILYMIVTFNPQWSMGVKELIIDNPLDSPFDTFRIQMILKILDICGKKLSQSKNKDNKENLNKFIEFLQMYILSKQYLSIEVENKIIACFDKLGGYTIYNDFSSALKNSSVYEGLGKEIDEELRQFEEKEAEKTKKVEKKEEKKEDKKLSEDMNEFKRDEDDEDIKIMNFDEELQKIISESLTKVQGASMSNSVINPLLDVKKKELNKNPPTGKMRLFTKNGNKIVITEIKKEDKKGENEEGEEDDIEDDEDYD